VALLSAKAVLDIFLLALGIGTTAMIARAERALLSDARAGALA